MVSIELYNIQHRAHIHEFIPRKKAGQNFIRTHKAQTGTIYCIYTISLHRCQILSPSETGFIVSAHRLTKIILLTLIATL